MFWWIQNWYCDIDAKNVDSGIELGKYNIVHHSSAFSGSSSLYVHYFNPTFRAIHSAANVCGCVGLWLLSSFYTHIGGAPFKKKKKDGKPLLWNIEELKNSTKRSKWSKQRWRIFESQQNQNLPEILSGPSANSKSTFPPSGKSGSERNTQGQTNSWHGPCCHGAPHLPLIRSAKECWHWGRRGLRIEVLLQFTSVGGRQLMKYLGWHGPGPPWRTSGCVPALGPCGTGVGRRAACWQSGCSCHSTPPERAKLEVLSRTRTLPESNATQEGTLCAVWRPFVLFTAFDVRTEETKSNQI